MIIIEYNDFLNESKKKKSGKHSFEEWWKISYEKKSDFWIAKEEIRKGYTDADFTHYKEKKMRSKYNKYLKRK